MSNKSQAQMFYQALRQQTEKHLAMMELLYGPNSITDPELRALIEKRPHIYGCYAGFIGKRPGTDD